MVKNCLFEERIIAKEQRGQARVFIIIIFFLKNGGLASAAFGLPHEAAGAQLEHPGQGTRRGVEAGTQLPQGFWSTDRGLGQSAGQSARGPMRMFSRSRGDFRNVCSSFAFQKSVLCHERYGG